jgi:hypothetical protein
MATSNRQFVGRDKPDSLSHKGTQFFMQDFEGAFDVIF